MYMQPATTPPKPAMSRTYSPYCLHAVRKVRQFPADAAACKPTTSTQPSRNSTMVNQGGIAAC